MTGKISIDSKQPYIHLISAIGNILEEGRRKALQSVNQILVKTYWEIGKQIVEFEQQGKEKAEYGSALLDTLSRDLKLRYGRGFSRRNVFNMRRLYLTCQNWQTLSAELSWSHHVELLSLEDDLERSFYEKQCIQERWSVRELKRQMNTALFHRIALSRDKKGVLELAQKGQLIETTKDIIRDPYVLEFLQIPEGHHYSEKELEQKIMDHIQLFLLELGKGFTFVGRQHRISLGGNHYYVDLVFYHRILKCFILIDLKIGAVTPQDVGQMNMYLNYFKKEESNSDDNPPLGIILGTEKDNFSIEYALGGITNQLFVSKYKLYLPDKKVLQQKLKELLEHKE
ncbi:MAG: PDDEXK nuclease domain-containing protein [Candidatus Woesearchaeota archaeon]|nr:PDDEXK nuclease domain-containing protein [Candidatus Woesearchaeota archaeon]